MLPTAGGANSPSDPPEARPGQARPGQVTLPHRFTQVPQSGCRQPPDYAELAEISTCLLLLLVCD